jgi:hypothetical protein
MKTRTDVPDVVEERRRCRPNACPPAATAGGVARPRREHHDAALGQLERIAGEVELAEQLKEWPAEDEGEVGGIRVREVGACRAAHGDHHGCGIDESAGEGGPAVRNARFQPVKLP